MSHRVKILSAEMLNHNVKRFVTEKPADYSFKPGQATMVELPDHRGDKHPFTFTSLPEDSNLEFTIKLYPQHHGFTNHLRDYSPSNELVIGDPWGAIHYKGSGVFIAGGAGITPFLAILRMLERENRIRDHELFFSNRSDEDVFLVDELRGMLGERAHFLVTEKPSAAYRHARIDGDFLRQHITNFRQYFYVCGPKKMVEEISGQLEELGAAKNRIVVEDLS